MLKTILAISGKPGLYKLISQAKNMLIVENLADKKRLPVYASDKVISLGDIAMYTDANDVPLATVLESIKQRKTLQRYSWTIKKLLLQSCTILWQKNCPSMTATVSIPVTSETDSWYNLLVASGETDFVEGVQMETVETAADNVQNVLMNNVLMNRLFCYGIFSHCLLAHWRIATIKKGDFQASFFIAFFVRFMLQLQP